MRIRSLLIVWSLGIHCAFAGGPKTELKPASVRVDATARAGPVTSGPIMAAHYFGSHWPKNFIGAFRRERVPEDFARLREDGFNTVIFVVSWGDFQPIIDPCCGYDERAFDRLHFLLRQARDAGLKVILRVGYIWSFHPEAGASEERAHLLMNQEKTREAYLAFVHRLGREIAGHPHVTMSFMSWEDQWLRTIAPDARAVFEDYASILPAHVRPGPGQPLPRLEDDGAAMFHAYWDWLVMYRLFTPARDILRNLSYEARIDKEPSYDVDAGENSRIVQWLDHRGMYRQPGLMPVTIYWAPFWGAQNVGEELTAERSSELLGAMLDEARSFSGGRALFIDQFNVVDNTIGHENNARILHDDIDAFLADAVCVMKRKGVIGYGFWTLRDYRESPLYNPAFAYGLEGWTLTPADGTPPERALETLAGGDHEVRLGAGDRLSQSVTKVFGRLPKEDGRPDRICVEAAADTDSELIAYAAANGTPAELRFVAGTSSQQCADILARPAAGRLTLRLVAGAGASLRMRDVWLFDHVQYGGIYDDKGIPGSHHDAVVRLNHTFGEGDLPAECNVD